MKGARTAPTGSSPDNLKVRTISALKWSAATQVANQVLRFGISIVLARLLSPHEFGLVAMLAVFTGFARQFTTLGFGASIIQRREVRPEQLDTVFWINVATGLVIAAALASCAPLIGRFYAEPTLVLMTFYFAGNFVVSSLNVVQSAMLQKSLNFRRLFWVDMLGTIVGGSVSVTLALRGLGVWSLVFDTLAVSATRLLVMWFGSSWRPRFLFDFAAVRELFGFSGNLMGTTAVTYWARNFDTLLVGKYFGDAAAGIYNRAYQLMMLPMTQVTAVLTRVMFPALAAIQSDIPRVRAVYLRATRIISLITFPLMMLLLVLARPMMLFLYGAKWAESIPLFQILCLAAISQSVGTTVGWIYTSQGRTDLQFKWGLVGTPLRVLSFIIGIRWGVTGMTIAYVFTGYFVTLYPSWTIPGRLIGLRFTTMIRNVVPTFLCAACASAIVWGLDFLLLAVAPNPVRFVTGMLLGAVLYYVLLIVFRVEAWADVVNLIHEGHLPASRRILPYLRRLPGFQASATPDSPSPTDTV